MLCTTLNPMVLLIIIPMKNGYFIGNIPNIFRHTHFYLYLNNIIFIFISIPIFWAIPISGGIWRDGFIILSSCHRETTLISVSHCKWCRSCLEPVNLIHSNSKGYHNKSIYRILEQDFTHLCIWTYIIIYIYTYIHIYIYHRYPLYRKPKYVFLPRRTFRLRSHYISMKHLLSETAAGASRMVSTQTQGAARHYGWFDGPDMVWREVTGLGAVGSGRGSLLATKTVG